MQSVGEKYCVPEVSPFTELGQAGRTCAGNSFNFSHEMLIHSSSSSREPTHQEQSPGSTQHQLQQQPHQCLQNRALPSQHRSQGLILPVAQRQQQMPQNSHALSCPNQPAIVVKQLPAGSDTPTRPSKAPDEIYTDCGSMANQSLTVEVSDGLAEDAERGCSGSRWPREETLALLRIRADMDTNFRDANLKGHLWEEISRYRLSTLYGCLVTTREELCYPRISLVFHRRTALQYSSQL